MNISKKKVDNFILTYDEYFNNNITLTSLKNNILKDACKKYKLKVGGKKSILAERLTEYFQKIKHVLLIQSIIRMKIAKNYTLYRGPAIKNRELCNNNTDFVSLEPINEIPFEYFFSYTDNNNFTYGFNIASLINILRHTRKIENPYNRSIIVNKLKNDIIKIYNCSYIINNDFKNNNKFFYNNTHVHNTIRRRNIHRPIPIISTVDNYNPRIIHINRNNNSQDSNTGLSEELNQRLEILQNVRELPLNDRVERLFVEIDGLGNYTNSSWFITLTHIQYVRFYRCLFDIWVYRGQLSIEIKRRICPFYEPFDGIFPRHIYHDNITSEQIKKACIIVMENLIYSSVDIEYRKIGALHSLTALTVVSHGARRALPWLYESLL